VISAVELSFNEDEDQARIFYGLIFRNKGELYTTAKHLAKMTRTMGLDRCVLLRKYGKHVVPDIFEDQTLEGAAKALSKIHCCRRPVMLRAEGERGEFGLFKDQPNSWALELVLDLAASRTMFGRSGPRDIDTFRTLGGCSEAELCIRYYFGVDFVRTSHKDYDFVMEHIFPLVQDQFPKVLLGRPQAEIRYHDVLLSLGELMSYYAVIVGIDELTPKERYLPEGVPRNLHNISFIKLQTQFDVLKEMRDNYREAVSLRRKEKFLAFGSESERKALHNRLKPKNYARFL